MPERDEPAVPKFTPTVPEFTLAVPEFTPAVPEFTVEQGNLNTLHPGPQWSESKTPSAGVAIQCGKNKCAPPMVCMHGADTCKCPLLLSGPACNQPLTLHTVLNKRNSLWSKIAKHPRGVKWNPFVSFADQRFGGGGNKTWGHLREVLKDGSMVPVPSKDLSRCAVVGSGLGLMSRKLGALIDKHTFVIRFNEAPVYTKGPKSLYTGTKTSLRVQNGQRCGYSDSNEFCIGFGPAGIDCDRWNQSKCRRLETPEWLESYWGRYWSVNPVPQLILDEDPAYDGRVTRLSGGFAGLMLAMSMCGEVNLYGFSQSEAHYYKKELGLKKNPNSKPKPWYAKHYFTVEKLAFDMINHRLIPGVHQRQPYSASITSGTPSPPAEQRQRHKTTSG
eukprot:CAMPEP_0198203406 /NCGR_PEP_ID=MMETSP1445-20131203/6700_1 /TAXON_ID=36898 /ORGANISM="Pyramimonas sp., Strain CCMP2087" /LENGTH=387 /DNA_ID=CAMNT_0043874793 /DNA_START=843 /DNA_END=2006 /DNA_ORIENTATION=+